MAEQVSPAWRGKIVHASLTVGNTVLMGADAFPWDGQQPSGFYVMLSVDDHVDAERIFHALAENGTVRMAMQKTFWSPAFGVLVDQFDIPWEICCEQHSTFA
jgi:PhnB protein